MARGRLCNASISGALITSPLPVNISARVQVRFTAMIDGRRRATSVEAEVVRREKGSFAVEWRELASEAVRALLATHLRNHASARARHNRRTLTPDKAHSS